VNYRFDGVVEQAGSILIVEDNDDDFESTCDALHNVDGFNMPVERAENGSEAIEFLRLRATDYRQGRDSIPRLILLDLNLPGMDGHGVLMQMKSSVGMRQIPVVVFSSSSSSEDIAACYAAGANAYVCKPSSLDELNVIMRNLEKFWVETNKLSGEH
jgi:two-component system response regulator